jgi:hypothetical protein
MATQSKSTEQLKSEVLKPSARPYELIEYNSDKIITGEINPGLINSNITTYEKNSEGTIIIDKNKDLSNQKMLISLNTTKISNTKFKQIIDTEFQDFILKADTSLLFLESQLAALQALAQQNRNSKKVDKDKIKQLLEQIALLEKQIIDLRALLNNVPDSIAYGTALYSDGSGLGNMLLSKHRRARGVINENGTFKVTLGNYDKDGKLINGAEKVTFDTYKPPGEVLKNINTYVLTDLEANQYLINNTDLEPYFNSRQPKAIAASQASLAANKRFAEAEDAYTTAAAVAYSNFIAVQNYSTNVTTVTAQQNAIIAAEIAKNVISEADALVIRDTSIQLSNITLNASRDKLNKLNLALGQLKANIERIQQLRAQTYSDLSYYSRNAPSAFGIPIKTQKFKDQVEKYQKTLRDYESQLAAENVKLNQIKVDITAEEKIYQDIQNQQANERTLYSNLVSSNASTIQGLSTNKTVIINNLNNASSLATLRQNKTASDAAMVAAKTVLDEAEAKKTAARNNPDIRLPINLYGWDAGGSLINAAKAHWRYINTSSKSELSTRFYLSDDEARAYLNTYPDLQAAFGTNLQLAKKHWNENGFNEGRTYSRGASLLHIWRNSADGKGYLEIAKTNPWSVRYSSEYTDLSRSSRIVLDDNGILYLYDKNKIVWQSFNE